MPILQKLLEKGYLESDPQGHYRLRKLEPTDRRKRTWISPQVKRILDRSSKDFTQVIKIDDEEEEVI